MDNNVSLLKYQNPTLTFYHILSSAFLKYGRIYSDFNVSSIVQLAISTFPFIKDTSYVASDSELEKCVCLEEIRRVCFGEMEIQAGLCWGNNSKLNGMEYHKSSEVIIAATNLVLILGDGHDITDSGWHSEKADCFYVPEGTVLELYSGTLHLAPCRTNQNPFYALIILPEGTNYPLDREPTGLLWMKNKWLLAHPESALAARGAAVGILGPNLEINTIEDPLQVNVFP